MATTYPGYLSAFTSFNSSTVGACRGFEITVEHATIDDTALGERWEGTQGGMGRWFGQGEFIADLADLGQLAITTQLAVASPVQAGVTAVFTLYTGKTLTGVIVIQSWRIVTVAEADAKVTLFITFKGDGAPTIA